jgi:hypothetical protein
MDHTSCFVGTKTEAKEYFSSKFKFYSIFFHFFSTPKKSEKENKHGHLGCIWFTFLGQPGSRGAGERRLVAYTAPEPGSPDAISLLLPASQKRQKRTFLQSQARLMHLFLTLMMY